MVRVTDIHFNIRCSQQFFFWDEDFLGKEDVRLKISFLKLVVPKDTNIFKNLTIPATSSKDGKEHIVQSEEEFLEYYQENLEEK